MYYFPDAISLIAFVLVIFSTAGLVTMIVMRYLFHLRDQQWRERMDAKIKLISALADIFKNNVEKMVNSVEKIVAKKEQEENE